MEWYDSAFTHQLVRKGDIARTRDDEYPNLDDDVLYNNCSDVGRLSIMQQSNGTTRYYINESDVGRL